MPTRLATLSQTRVWAREIIDKVIAENVLGPVQSLPKSDLLELRKIIRQRYPLAGLSSWQKKILREELRYTLGYPLTRTPKMRRIHYLTSRDVLPSMLPWAKAHGLISDP
jgi:hypothetical protein